MNINSDASVDAPEVHREFTQEEAIYMRHTLQAIADMGKPRDVHHAYDLYTLVASMANIALDMVTE